MAKDRNDSAAFVFDADSHVLEPASLWSEYIDPKFRDRAPRVVTDDQGRDHFHPDPENPAFAASDVSIINLAGAWGARDSTDAIPESYEKGARGGFDPHARIAVLDAEGIDATLLYATLGLALGTLEDAKLAAADARAYNRWLGDFCKPYPNRLYGAALIPLQTTEVAIEELRFAVEKLGFRTATILPYLYRGRALHDPSLYPFWEVAQDLDVGIGIHAGGGSGMESLSHGRFTSKAVSHCAEHTFEMMAAALSLIMHGVCDKFPRLRFAFNESGGGWMVGWLERMDRHFDDVTSNDTGLKTRPSEIFRRQCFISFEPIENSLKVLAEYMGPENIIWGSDYPHPDGFPNTPRLLKNLGLKPDIETAILSQGAKSFCGLT